MKKSRIIFYAFTLLMLFTGACSIQTPTATTTRLPTDTSMPELTQTPITETALPVRSPTPEAVSPAQAEATTANLDCTSPANLTPALTEGPYFKANSPERASLIDDNMKGTQLILSGYVLTTDCQPVAGALLDFWQADADGHYDNAGYTLRGHQFTDENGHYQLTTVVPGLYPGRTEHIHFKVQAPGGPVLTSQLFFPGVSENESDGIFDPALIINVTKESSTTFEATYNFIIAP